jgi:hypothetical protein
MKNLRIRLPLVDGSQLPLDFETAREIVHRLAGDDFGAPPHSLVIEAVTDDGRVVSIGFPYDNSQEAWVEIKEAGEWTPPYERGDRVQNLLTNKLGTVKECQFNGPVLVYTDEGLTMLWPLDEVGRTTG